MQKSRKSHTSDSKMKYCLQIPRKCKIYYRFGRVEKQKKKNITYVHTYTYK